MKPDQALRRQDAEAREAACICFDRPLVLEAGAGTGKTATLIARMLHWAIGPGWEQQRSRAGSEASPDQIAILVWSRTVAITFTEKAAAEMAQRLADGLKALIAGQTVLGMPAKFSAPATEQLKHRLSALLTHLDRVSLGTIHAFCRHLLARHPFEAELHPNFQVDGDGGEVRRQVEQLCRQELESWYGEPGDPDAQRLAALGFDPVFLASLLTRASQEHWPLEALANHPYRPEALSLWLKSQQQAAERVSGFLQARLPEAGGGKRLDPARAVEQALRGLTGSSSQDRDLESWKRHSQNWQTSGALSKLQKWAKEGLNRTEIKALGNPPSHFAEACAQLHSAWQGLMQADPELLPALFRFLHRAYGAIQRQLNRRGLVVFQELLHRCADLMERHESIRRLTRSRFDQVLVDEFQDTDPWQCRLLEQLCLRPDSTPAPTLFLVGDPKQSIYAWRHADLAAYEAFVQKVMALGGERHRLSVNFRSVPGILQEVEAIHKPIMPEIPGLQPAFQSLLAAPKLQDHAGFAEDQRRPLELWLAWAPPEEEKAGPDTLAERARELEAAALAQDLSDLHRQKLLQWHQAAVLMRSTTRQEVYLQALREAGVPYLVERDRSYYQKREIQDAGSWLQAVLDPHAQTALVGALRSPWVGVPDRAWLPLWQEGFPAAAVALDGEDVSALRAMHALIDRAAAKIDATDAAEQNKDWPYALKAAMDALAELRADWHRLPAESWLEKFRFSLDAETVEAGRYLGLHRLANLQRFFHQIGQWLQQGMGKRALLREWRACQFEGEGEVASPGDEGLDAVRILTIHKAKGLTFDHVYLVNGHGQSGANAAALQEEWMASENGFEFRLGGAATLGFHQAKRRQKEIQAAEAVRTLYVALTRARFRLVVAGRGSKKEIPSWNHASSFWELLQHREGGWPDWSDFWQQWQGKPDLSVDHPWLIRVLGAKAKRGEAAQKPAAPAAFSWEEAFLQEQRLQQARAQAQQRSLRPYTAAVTGVRHPQEGIPAGETATRPESKSSAIRPNLALAVGSAIHQALQHWDFQLPLEQALAAQKDRLAEYLKPRLVPADLPPALERAEDLWQRFGNGILAEELHRLGPHVIGRELPLLLHSDTETGPVGACIGTLDLLYQDPETGTWVIADFKTDRVEDEEGLQARCRLYAEQGQQYRRAVSLAYPKAPLAPFLEFWFLFPGQRLRVTPSKKLKS